MRMKAILAFVLMLIAIHSFAQTEIDERAMVDFRKGLGFNAPDSTFGINLRLRMQNRAVFYFNEQAEIQDIEARVSRLRLRFDGYILSRRITYYVQLSFTRGDQDWDNTYIPNVVRDAMVYYRFNNNFYVGFGQGKLPGNRQRIISSGQQQFHDRSVANAAFTLDRDFGLFGYYSSNLVGLPFNIKTAISSGEGRNQLRTDNGLMYTGRIELLPLGKFSRDGDFSEGDLEFEQTPKLSLAAGYAFNHKARRSRGTTGSSLYESRNMQTFFADAVLKYRGWAISGEFLNRNISDHPFTYRPSDSAMVAALEGKGVNIQLSYCLPSYWEIAMRYANAMPNASMLGTAPNDRQILLGVNKYINKHLTKFQTFVGYRYQNFEQNLPVTNHQLSLVFQVELGI